MFMSVFLERFGLGIVVMLGSCFLFFAGFNVCFAVTASPLVEDVEVEEGFGAERSFFVANNSVYSRVYTVSLVPVDAAEVLAGGDLMDGEFPEGVLEQILISTEAFFLDPGEETEVLVAMGPFEGVQPGVYSFGVKIVEELEERGGGVTVQSGVMPLVFLTIDGERLVQGYGVTEFLATPVMTSVKPVDILLDVRNSGEQVLQPYGTIVIENLFGQERARLPFNAHLHRVLPGGEREFGLQWVQGEASGSPDGFFDGLKREVSLGMIGLFRVKPDLRTSIDGAVMPIDAIHIVMVPWRVLLLISVLLGGSIVCVRFFQSR